MVCAACAADGDCASGNYCDLSNNGGTCTPAKANGAACSATDQCTSGFCANGVCCNSACNTSCQACTAALKGTGSDGTCGPVAAGTADPKGVCTDQGAMSCGTDGKCDGAGACQKYMAGTSCGAVACLNGTLIGARTCDGMGTCQQGSMMSCSPYAKCNGNACATMCSTSADCAAGFACNGGACVASKANGSACATGTDCMSTFCVDGVCCESACSGTCNNCNLAGMAGTCGIQNGGTNNANHPCANSHVCLGTDSSTCVACVADANCTGGFKACDTTQHACVQCTATNSTACTGNNPVCDTTMDADYEFCVHCNVLADCPNGSSSCTNHTCM
jgi:hypothetical protein